jgi:hypothetical protein
MDELLGEMFHRCYLSVCRVQMYISRFFLSLVQKHIAMQHLSWKLMSLDGTIPLCRDFWLNCLSPVQEFFICLELACLVSRFQNLSRTDQRMHMSIRMKQPNMPDDWCYFSDQK